MQCPQCQHANAPDAKFCDECGTSLTGPCTACGIENRPAAKFCKACGTSLLPHVVQNQPDAESRLHAVLPVLSGLLQREGRLTYRELKHVFGIDDALLDEIRDVLTFRRRAIDEDGKGLVWTGEAPLTVAPIRPPALPEAVTITSPAPPDTEANTLAIPETVTAEAPQGVSTTPSEPTRTGPEAERRQLTVMFCDLADSTKLSQQLDPEDLREVVRAYQQTAAEVIHRYAGHMAQYLGDGLLIYFGWPIAHEDDAQRALHAGLEIVEAITGDLNPHLHKEQGVQLTVRLGIHTGPVVVGEMGGSGRQESLATGETVNIAARLEGLAEPDTVVISNVTARLMREAFVLEDLGPQVLKGIAEPIGMFRVIGPAEVHRDEDERLPNGGVFLVGRDEERGLLLRRWEQAKEGFGQVVLISGEAGIGKSSLVATARSYVLEEGSTRITFRCSPYHTNSALYPVIMHLEQMLGFDRDDTSRTKLDKLEQVLRTTNLPLKESAPLLATLLSVPIDDRYPTLTLSPQQQRQQTLDTLVAWLLEESEKLPMLVIWEDMHWGDPSTLEMLGLVLEQTPTIPMLHLLTFRPEFNPPWPTRSHMTPLTLNRLERPQVEGLLMHLARGKRLPADVVEHIVAKTDGVPLYVEELTKMLLESELLREDADRYVLTGPLVRVAIPDTLQDSLMARLDQMQTAKEVAQLGAVIGREFPYEMLQAIASQDETTVQTGLAQLVEAELLYQRGRPPRARYVFKHALIQDAAYASLLKSMRQQYHRQIAETIEERFPETVETQPELVAHHYTEAGLNPQAIDYWQRTGQHAVQRSANQEAISHLSKGLALLPNLPDTPERVQHELDMLMTLGPTLMAIKGWTSPDVERVYVRAQELCQQIGETPQLLPVLIGLRRFSQVRGDLRTARQYGQQLLALAERQHDTAWLLEGHRALGDTLFWMGEFAPARTHLEQGVALYNVRQHSISAYRYGLDSGLGCAIYAALTLWHLGYPDQALVHIHNALTLADKVAHPQSLAFVLCWAAWLHQLRREERKVHERSEEAIALSTAQGFTTLWAIGTMLRGMALTAQGQYAEGIAQLREGWAAWQAPGTSGVWVTTYHAALAEAYGKSDRFDEGLTVLTEGLTLVEAYGERVWEAELHRLKGEFMLIADCGSRIADWTPEKCFQKALDVACQQHAKSLELRAATSLARLWQSQGKRPEAHALLAPVYAWFTEGFDTADLQEAKALLNELE